MRALPATAPIVAPAPIRAATGTDSDLPYVTLHAPSVLLIADEPQRSDALALAVLHAGGRVVASVPLSAALDEIDGRGLRGAANVVLDIAADGGATLDLLLDRLDDLTANGRLSVLVLTPLAHLDIVAARVAGPGIAILVDPAAAERDAALADLLAISAGRVGEDGDAENRRKLAQLGDEVGRIARALAALSGERAPARGSVANNTPPVVSQASLVRSILRLRRLRGLHFEPALFADPAWDILLDLVAARIEGRAVAVSSLCIAAAVPATTALRWIAQMTEQALLVRYPDETDGRRVFVALSEVAAGAMDNYLAAAQRIIAPVV